MPMDTILTRAFAIVESEPDMKSAIVSLRDILEIDHLVYHSSRLGVSPASDPYIQLTYPPDWIKRYLEMGYVNLDPVLREGFSRTLPFDWSELKPSGEAETAFFYDALCHGVGPHGMSIPVRSKQGHRGLFSLSFSGDLEAWRQFRERKSMMAVEIANRVHVRVVREVFGEDRVHLTRREVDCLRLVSLGKGSTDISLILGLSAHTVRDYLKSARYKLDCVTVAQAASRAIKLGFLRD
jgi:DNA-binding CsgD family transcriptional regulator